MNLIQLIDCWRVDDEFSWNNICFIVENNFDMGKNIRGFFDNLFEYYFLNIITLYYFWILYFVSNLKFEYYYECYPETLLQESVK